MGYSDQKYYARPLSLVIPSVDFGTSTAAGTASNSLAGPAGTPPPKFNRKAALTNIQVIVLTAPNASATAVTLTVLSGTNTAGSVVVTGGTAGQIFINSVTGANSTFTASAAPTVSLIGTFTASGGTAGKYLVLFEDNELPA